MRKELLAAAAVLALAAGPALAQSQGDDPHNSGYRSGTMNKTYHPDSLTGAERNGQDGKGTSTPSQAQAPQRGDGGHGAQTLSGSSVSGAGKSGGTTDQGAEKPTSGK